MIVSRKKKHQIFNMFITRKARRGQAYLFKINIRHILFSFLKSKQHVVHKVKQVQKPKRK